MARVALVPCRRRLRRVAHGRDQSGGIVKLLDSEKAVLAWIFFVAALVILALVLPAQWPTR